MDYQNGNKLISKFLQDFSSTLRKLNLGISVNINIILMINPLQQNISITVEKIKAMHFTDIPIPGFIILQGP